MPKSRIMGAGLASSTNSGSRANVNQVQFGDKLQGLPPTRNKRVEFVLRNIQKRSYGENRNHVFCMNQIGGIGAVGSGNRSRTFATTADGVKDCVPTTTKCKLQHNVAKALKTLNTFASTLQGMEVCLVGINETVLVI